MLNLYSKYYFLHPKLFTLIVSTFIFSILYLFLDDSHFSGVNYIKETIKKEVIKKKIDKEIENKSVTEPMTTYDYETEFNKIKSSVAIEDATKDVKEEVEKDELKAEKINVSLAQKLFNRIYYSFNTSCLLGNGDIYPVSNISKLFTMVQSLLTVSIIVF
jgi:hypothetical protein